MKHSIKGALLSGLVLPGLGQLVLKHHKRGIALIITVLACFAVITIKAFQQASAILKKIQSEGGVIDMSAITNAATQASTNSDSSTITAAFLLMLVCWIFAVVDAYRIGKRKDQGEIR